MKKLFTLFATVLSVVAFAGTPIINGIYNPAEGWGTQVGTGDGNVGWSNANAKKLYVTYDNNYVYFGAECSADSWQQFIFVVNNKSGGSSTDSWGRQINYNHTNKPDFLFRGDIAGGNYAEFHSWNGTAWTGTGTNANASGTEVKGVFAAATPFNGFIEIRIPRSLIGFGLVGDVQFIVGGNNSDHGSFDAIPNDNNSTGWTPPTSISNLTQYVTNVSMPANLTYFSGDFKNGNANLGWQSTTEVNFSQYEVEQSANASNWNKIATVPAKGNNSSYTASVAMTQNTWYRLKMVDKDGSFAYSNAVLLKTAIKKSIELLSNPIKDVVRVSINNSTSNYTVEIFTVDGKRVAVKNYQHSGGVSTLTINAPNAKGLYYIKFTNASTIETLKFMVD